MVAVIVRRCPRPPKACVLPCWRSSVCLQLRGSPAPCPQRHAPWLTPQQQQAPPHLIILSEAMLQCSEQQHLTAGCIACLPVPCEGPPHAHWLVRGQGVVHTTDEDQAARTGSLRPACHHQADQAAAGTAEDHCRVRPAGHRAQVGSTGLCCCLLLMSANLCQRHMPAAHC